MRVRIEAGEILLDVALVNSGLAEVTIHQLIFAMQWAVLMPIGVLTQDVAYEGPELPKRIQGNHTEHWVFSASEALTKPGQGTMESHIVRRPVRSYRPRSLLATPG